MRITSGVWRGKPISAPAGLGTRPTSYRARQAIFNILEHAPWSPPLAGSRVIDLFAGSGALGLEALSRGAAFVLFVETDAAARGAIRDNIEALGAYGHARIHRRDATDLGPRPGPIAEAFDLALLDPPYRQGLGQRAIEALAAGNWLRPNAHLVLECAADEPDPELAGCQRLDARVYGAAKVLFLQRSNT